MSERKNDLVTIQPAAMTLEGVREKLKAVRGKKYWRSVDELANTPEFQEAVEREFPGSPHAWGDDVSRRGFLRLMGASVALAGLAGCTKQPDEPIYPYIKQPEDLILGKPNYFATAHPFVTGAVPLLVKTDQYRPIKIDGNPEHPYNQGSSDPFTQATLLDLYDPDRSQHVTYRGENREWAEFAQELRLKVASTKDGTGIYFLSETITSPTLARQWREVQAKYPKATLVQYDPAIAGTAAAGGLNIQYDLADADMIVSLDADFLSGASFPGFHKLVRQYAERRKNPEKLNRLYAIESTPTTTGLKAEHRLGLRASEIPAFAAELAKALGVPTAEPPAYNWTDEQKKFLAELAKDLKAHMGKSVVIPGLYQDPSVFELTFSINGALNNLGKTAHWGSDPYNLESFYQTGGLKALVADLNAGKVDWLVILNTNPIYNAPADLEFAAAFEKAKMTAHLGSHIDETGQNAQWHIPAAHFLESWSDARAYDGTVSIVQPMIDPLYGGHTAHQFFQALLDEPGLSPYDAVRETWKTTIKGDFETGWRKALHSGWIEGTTYASSPPRRASWPSGVMTVSWVNTQRAALCGGQGVVGGLGAAVDSVGHPARTPVAAQGQPAALAGIAQAAAIAGDISGIRRPARPRPPSRSSSAITASTRAGSTTRPALAAGPVIASRNSALLIGPTVNRP